MSEVLSLVAGKEGQGGMMDYVEWLRSIPWQLFCTLRFAWRVSDAQAVRVFNAFVNIVEKQIRQPLAYIRGDEKRASGCGKPAAPRHYHALFAAGCQLEPDWLAKVWMAMAGSGANGAGAEIRVYDPSRNGLAYTLKFIFQPNGDWDFRSLDLFLTADAIKIDSRKRRRLARHATRLLQSQSESNSTSCTVPVKNGALGVGAAGSEINTAVAGAVAGTKEAAAFDEQFRAQFAKVKEAEQDLAKANLLFGKLCDQMRSEKLHGQIASPNGSAYVTFEEYVHGATGGAISSAALYISIACYRLTTGPNALSPQNLAEIPISNAYELSKVKPERRGTEILQLAKETSNSEFAAKVRLINGQPLRADFVRKLSPEVAKELESTIERFMNLPAIRDGDRTLSLEDKAIHAMCFGAQQFALEDLQAVEGCSQPGPDPE